MSHGHKGYTREGKGFNPDAMRGHPYSVRTRLRQIRLPPTGFDDPARVRITLCTGNLEEDYARERVDEMMEMEGASIPPEIESLPHGVWTIDIAQADLALLKEQSEAVKAGQFTLDAEDDEPARGIYVMEPHDQMFTTEIREQQFIVRLPASGILSITEVFSNLAEEIKTSLRSCDRMISRDTLKWVDAGTPDALSAERTWEVYLRQQEVKGHHMIQHFMYDPI
jgi:hypothetical protein